MKQISFRITVVSLFIFLAVFIITFTNLVQIYASKSFAEDSSNQNFQFTSSKVQDNLKNIDTQSSFYLNATSSSLHTLNSIEQILHNKPQYIQILTNILKQSNNLYAAYFAFLDGSFFEVINLNIDKRLQEQYKLDDSARWLLIYIKADTPSKRYLVSYDEKFNSLTQRIETNSYNPTLRPWFQNALKATNSITKTTPYLFKHIDSIGTTYAKQFTPKTILATDVLLHNLKDTLEELKTLPSMDNFFFLDNGELISSTNSDESLIKNLQDFLAQNKHLEEGQTIYMMNEMKYIINFSKIGQLSDEYLISIVLLDEAMGQYADYFNKLTLFTILLFMILLPLIWYFASIIVKPVLYLKKQSALVKNRNYSNLQPITSRVQEIQELSDAMVDMADSIHIYQNDLEDKVTERTLELEEKNKELERISVTDKLTNIYNRIKLDLVLEEEIMRAKRYDEIFSLMIVDVDHFKLVNDTYGHQVGDTTLVELANILKSNVRKTDTVGRWGGEEFIIIAPHTDINGIAGLANSLREKIEHHIFPTIGTKTASFGVTMFKNNEDTIEKMISRADQALYIAKENGRNRVEKVMLDH